MANKRFFYLILFILLNNRIFCTPIIKFQENLFDFGIIKEEIGTVSHTFIFSNEGNSDLILEKVKPS